MALQKRRAWVSVALGLVLGFTTATWFVVPRVVSSGSRRSRAPSACGAPAWSDSVPQPAKQRHDEPSSVKHGRAVPGATSFLYVGVMTAAKYLEGRAWAAQRTWAGSIPGRVEFFSSEDSRTKLPLPVVALPTVDDSYPPQKKSFLMLKYMHDHYLERFEWFVRADDDVYVRGERLEAFLRRLNSSEPLYLGQTGLGVSQELGKLALEQGDNFCMGGPGVVLSREALRRTAPHVSECLRTLHTTHEDVELGRCVRRFGGTQCVWSYEMQQLFYEHYEHRRGFIQDLHSSKLRNAITLHPNKQPPYQFLLHTRMLSRRIASLRAHALHLLRDIVRVARLAGVTYSLGREEERLGQPLSLTWLRPQRRDDVPEWDFLTGRLLFGAAEGTPPRRVLPPVLRPALEEIITEVMESINVNSHARGRVIDFKEIQYGYVRLDPLRGASYVLDLLLLYKRFSGKKITVPVRRHAYLQQSFGRTAIDFEHDWEEPTALAIDIDRSAYSSLFSLFSNPLRALQGEQNVAGSGLGTEGPGGEMVNVLVPLTGRLETFGRFLKLFEQTCLRVGENVRLVVLLFDALTNDEKEKGKSAVEGNKNGPSLGVHGDSKKHRQLLAKYQQRYPKAELELLPMSGPFSRGVALEVGASRFPNSSLLFFCDVDLAFTPSFLHNCRTNALLGQKVYFPIVFSQYDPRFAQPPPTTDTPGTFLLTRRSGFWRDYGYGITCIHRGDLAAVGGFDTSIRGWGLEDVDLFSRVVQAGLEAVRSQEPGAVHVYHPVVCDPALEPRQLRMCLSSRAAALGDKEQLAQAWLEIRGGFNRTGS
uniref:Hexosyltransferase n=1 Tax=Eptatretus burgeri TaxID=7764 RepID=A0A8C4R6J7_EPTBU